MNTQNKLVRDKFNETGGMYYENQKSSSSDHGGMPGSQCLAGCGSKKSDEKVIKIGVFERPPVRTEAEAIRKYWYPLCQRDAPHRQHRRRGICCQAGGVDNKSDKTEAVNAARSW